MTTGVKGTLEYLSPELLNKGLWDQKAIDLQACDMWALGITMY